MNCVECFATILAVAYKIRKLIATTKMLFSTKECVEKYGNFYQIAAAIRRGELFKIEPGVYSDDEGPREIEVLLRRYPNAAVTLQSAYYYYDLSDVVPDRYYLSMERGGTIFRDERVVGCVIPKGTKSIGVHEITLRDTRLRIFDKERLLIETARMRTKLPYDIYKEVIGRFREQKDALYTARMCDYLESFPRKEAILRVIESEVL